MPMKRILLLFLIAMCLLGAGVIAHADEPLDVLCAFTPADFTEPCTAKLSVTVHNSSEKRIENARIFQDPNKEGEVIGTIEPGETLHFACDVQITKKMLDAGSITFTLSYKIDKKTYKQQATAQVTFVEHLAKASLTARIFKSAVYAGENVQVEYRLRNTGEIEIIDAVVSDAAFSYVSEPFSLAAGEEKALMVIAPFSQNAISTPRANFLSAQSGNPYVVHAPNSAIHVTTDSLSFSIEPESVQVAYGERAHFSVSVKNTGLLTYPEIELFGDGIGMIPLGGAALRPQDQFTFQLETPPVTQETAFPIRLTLREAGGTERTFSVGEMKISVSEEPARNPILTVSANAQGDYPFTLTIRGANRNLKNVKLSEKSHGEIKTFLTLEADKETVFSPVLSAVKGEAFEFALSWEENGEVSNVAAAPVISRITYSKDKNSSLTETAHASLYAIVSATKLPRLALIINGALMLAAVAYIIFSHLIKAKKRRRRAQEATSRTSKFAPIRTRDTEKENP